MRPLVLTPGDPAGIGPEIAIKALSRRGEDARPVVLAGSREALQAARVLVPDAPPLVSVSTLASPLPDRGLAVWDPGDDAEPVEVAAIRGAVHACLQGEAAALVTGPIHKARLAARGFAFPGHTDFLGHLCGIERPVMAFVGGQLRVALVTVHLPLRAVPDALTIDGVAHVIHALHDALRDQVGLQAPRLAVCGLNPHAGDDGLLGREEIDVIAPAIARCQQDGIDALGPTPAEAAVRQGADGTVDGIVAMYHDQGLAPLKLVDFGRSVNWTLGLPMIRTSVDHGTADDIAGQGIADPTSLLAAIRWAERLAALSEGA